MAASLPARARRPRSRLRRPIPRVHLVTGHPRAVDLQAGGRLAELAAPQPPVGAVAPLPQARLGPPQRSCSSATIRCGCIGARSPTGIATKPSSSDRRLAALGPPGAPGHRKREQPALTRRLLASAGSLRGHLRQDAPCLRRKVGFDPFEVAIDHSAYRALGAEKLLAAAPYTRRGPLELVNRGKTCE